MKTMVKMVVLLAALLLFNGFVQAATIRVEAFIDGRSRLIIKGNTAQWQHFDAAAPGDPGGANNPTIINSVNWFPVWSGVTRDCNGCYSDVFSGVCPGLAAVEQTVTLTTIQQRDGDPTIIQQPLLANDYTLIVEFNDNPSGGAFWYIIELDFPSSVPGPGCCNCYEVNCKDLDHDFTITHFVELCFGDNAGMFNGFCGDIGDLSLFFERHPDQAIASSQGSVGYLKFHEWLDLFNGVMDCYGERYTVHGRITRWENCPDGK